MTMWLGNNEFKIIRLNIDATQFSKLETSQGKIVIEYEENNGRGINRKRKEFQFHLRILPVVIARSVLSIDFGTTNTCAAFTNNDGLVETIIWPPLFTEAEEDNKSVPSYIYFSDRIEEEASPVKIGMIAKDAYKMMKRNTFHSIKRFICSGRQETIFSRGAYQEITYEQMTADYLRELINVLKDKKGIQFDRYIFTHPTDFGKLRKNKFEEIVQSLGLTRDKDSIDYIDEATAGALDKLKRADSGEHFFLIYDFGGGTTDIVFAQFTHTEYDLDELGTTEKKCLRPIFTTGYDLGGDDINYSIIQGLMELYFKKKGMVIPFVPPDKVDEIPGTFRPEKEMSHLQSNAKSLWNFAEGFKRNIFNDSFSSEEKFALISNSNLHDISSWRFDKVEEAQSLDSDELILVDKDFFNELRNRTFQECGKKISEVIVTVMDYISKSEYKDEPINILLLGRSSRFPMVKDLFEYYVKGNEACLAKYQGFKPLNYQYKFSPDCSIELPEELKHVVVTGALEWQRGFGEIDIKNDIIHYAIYNSTGPLFIQPGKEKVGDICDLIQAIRLDEYSKFATFCTKKFIELRQIQQIKIVKRSVKESTPCGNLQVDIPYELQDIPLRLCIYIDANEELRWFVFDQ
jgi:hypothetical protein